MGSVISLKPPHPPQTAHNSRAGTGILIKYTQRVQMNQVKDMHAFLSVGDWLSSVIHHTVLHVLPAYFLVV